MWWHRPVRIALALALALPVAGCFRPLYGPTASGVPLTEALGAIEVTPVSAPQGQERLAHYLRSELIFDLDGSGQTRDKRYRLTLDAAESVQTTTIDTLSGRSDAAILNATVKYALLTRDGGTLTAGIARGTATYYRDQQRFASVRAARDAEIRVARLIAEDLKQRLAAYFATAR